MQFKKVGKRIQVLAYRGYDTEKRRAVVKMLGSFDAYTHETPAELLDNLSDEEKAELKDYISGLKQQSSERYEQILISHLGRDVVKVAGLILDENSRQSEQWGNEMWAALEIMQKSLRKAGFKRPMRQPKPKPVKQQQAGLELNQQWAEEALVALDAVQQTLKKAGFKLPEKRAKSKPVNQQQAGLDLD